MTTELLFVGGELVPAVEGGIFTVTEPGNGSALAEVAEAGPEDARRAVDVAVRAFEEVRGRGCPRPNAAACRSEPRYWSGAARGARADRGSGTWASRSVTRGTRSGSSLTPWSTGGAANKIFGETVPVQDPGLDVTLREPVGVRALITPWNFPLVIATWKISPALACGNAIVVKPASLTPLSLLRLAEILSEAGLPDGTGCPFCPARVERRQRARDR